MTELASHLVFHKVISTNFGQVGLEQFCHLDCSHLILSLHSEHKTKAFFLFNILLSSLTRNNLKYLDENKIGGSKHEILEI